MKVKNTMADWIKGITEEHQEEVREKYKKAKTFKKKIDILKTWHPKGHLSLKPIKNLETYFKYIRVCTTDSTWFRGESKNFGSLKPKLYRNIDSNEIVEQQAKERKYFLEFKRRARSMVPDIDENDNWSWYFLIQHYGGPTRLLDWTQDAAIALFFALNTDIDDANDPIITCLTPTALLYYAYDELGYEKTLSGKVLYPGDNPSDKWLANIIVSDDNFSTELPSSPIALLPSYLNPRITAQRSCFTLFGNRMDGFYMNGKHIVCPLCNSRIFNKLIIDGKSKNDLRKELIKIGITNGKIYPGLDGLCKEITYEIYQ